MDHDEREERIAIMIYDGGLTDEEATRRVEEMEKFMKATGDGMTDDTKAIQRWLGAAKYVSSAPDSSTSD